MLVVPSEYSEAGAHLLPDNVVSSPHVALSLDAWVPGLSELRAVEEIEGTELDGQRPISFVVDTIELPTAAARWRVAVPEYPQLTFDDLRQGASPQLTEAQLAARRRALELARTVRDSFDIRPLTTGALLRQIREGKGHD